MPDDGNVVRFGFDYRNPDYVEVFRKRRAFLERIRAEPQTVPSLKRFYRENPAQFITDWGLTYDPRNVERGLPAWIPFILFPRQRAFVQWVLDRWRTQTPGLGEKSRDMGVSWLMMSIGCTLALFFDGFAMGVGSRKEEYVDRIGSPKTLFWKARQFMRHIPREFRGGYEERRDAPFMRLVIPETGSVISGEAGDNIGRGDRESIYFVDEHAYLEHPDMADAALSQTTNCQIDISSVRGMANSFAQKRHKPGMPEDYVFIFDWHDDPRKDQAWYEKQVRDLDPVIVAQEIDRDYAASIEGVVIAGAWVRAALDFHKRFGVAISGEKRGAFDVADAGKDKNAFCGAHGFVIERIEEWSGKGSDIFGSVEHVFNLCDELGYHGFDYDGDGLGAGARGDARKINDARSVARRPVLDVRAFRGSAAVADPSGQDEPGRLNEDFFANAKAQGWWNLRRRFRNTFRLAQEHKEHGRFVSVLRGEDIISIDSACPGAMKLVAELSQATFATNGVGKIVIDKTPEGAKSPNMADATVIRFAKRGRTPIVISDQALAMARRR